MKNTVKNTVMIALLTGGLMTVLTACGGQTENISLNVKNPLTEITLDQAAEELGLEKIQLGDEYGTPEVTGVFKIDGDPVIYSIDYTSDAFCEGEFELRIAKSDDSSAADISGVYLNGDILKESYSYTAADGTEAEIITETDGSYTKAYAAFGGYVFSMSSGLQVPEDVDTTASLVMEGELETRLEEILGQVEVPED